MIEIKLKEQDDFLKIKETLTRIGVSNFKKDVLNQSCHILHKQGKYYIVHFKDMLVLDGFENTITEEDNNRTAVITSLLVSWGLCEYANPEEIDEIEFKSSKLTIIPFKEKDNWELKPRYTMGVRK